MFQTVGLIVVVMFALYAANILGWLPENIAQHLPHSATSEEMAGNIEMPYNASEDPEQKPYADFAPGEKTFTERVTGERNPNR